ncbi:MAG: FAD-dependent oxidoreductase [Bacilli bacterium]|nr:FAD-dependent oxidoreductase [Bacilli bacterium]
MEKIYDSIIIGAGISGMTSAIYLKRYNLDILILEKQVPGGQISKASIIENYPGIKAIDGTTFSMNLLDQIQNLKIELKYEEVVNIIEEDKIKIVETKDNKYYTKTIIIGTGRRPKSLNIGEEKYIGKGISYCATCDGMFYKNEDVIVVGGGNSALEESIYLSSICKSITILNRSNKLKADQILIDKIKKISNIKILLNSNITKINGENYIESIETNNNLLLKCKAVFIYIGLIPNTEEFKNIKCENGYIIVDKNQMTNKEGIYAVGDVVKKDLYQLITAASDGAIAANSIKNKNSI